MVYKCDDEEFDTDQTIESKEFTQRKNTHSFKSRSSNCTCKVNYCDSKYSKIRIKINLYMYRTIQVDFADKFASLYVPHL